LWIQWTELNGIAKQECVGTVPLTKGVYKMIPKIVEIEGRYVIEVRSTNKGVYYRGIDENSYEDFCAFLNFIYETGK